MLLRVFFWLRSTLSNKVTTCPSNMVTSGISRVWLCYFPFGGIRILDKDSRAYCIGQTSQTVHKRKRVRVGLTPHKPGYSVIDRIQFP